MYRIFHFFVIIIAIVCVLPMICLAAGKLPVFVSIVPQKYFVQQIGKDLVEVQAMVLPGSSPATYEPKPQQMADLSAAKIYFAIGVPFENTWLGKIAAANPSIRVVHTDHDIEKLAMEAYHDHEEGEQHGEEKHDRRDADGEDADGEEDLDQREGGLAMGALHDSLIVADESRGRQGRVTRDA